MQRLVSGVAVLGAAALLLGATGCNLQNKKAEPTAPASPAAAISETKALYTQALGKAKAWHDNAVLLRVYRQYEGTLTPNSPEPLTFSFSSLSEPTKVYLVETTKDSVKEEKRERPPFEVNFTPIDVGEWQIDPDTALRTAEDAGGNAFRQAHLAGYKVLEQLNMTGGHPLQWYFRYDTGDHSRKRLEIYVNAKTGKVDSQAEKQI